MKNKITLLTMILFITFNTYSQFVKNWEVSAPLHWFEPATNSNNSVAYNPVTENLIVTVRGIKPYVVNSQTGALIDSLNEGTIADGFRYSKVRVTSDGVIYSCNLATGAGNWFLYRWANQTAVPTRSTFIVSARTGDSFEVQGSGTNTKIFASGSANTKIYVLTTTNGTDFNITDSITVAAGLARGGIATEAGKEFLWVNGAGTKLTKISMSGTVLAEPTSTSATTGFPTDSVNTAYHTATYFEHNGGKFVVITGRNSALYGKVFALYNMTNSETQPVLYGWDTLAVTYNANTNATGDVAIKKNSNGTVTLFHVVTNNGLASWTTIDAPLPVELASFSVSLNGSSSLLKWTTATELNSSKFIVEKKLNNRWVEIATVKAAGNSSTIKNYSYSDLNPGYGNFSYRLKIVDFDGSYVYSNAVNIDIATPNVWSLEQNYPNPFNPVTKIRYQVAGNEASHVQLKIYNVLGVEIETLVNGFQQPGSYEVNFDGSKLSSGTYIYKLTAGEFTKTMKMVLMK